MSDTMRGVIFVGNGRIELRQFPRPKPRGREVLVRMKAAGLCGSDMRPFRNPPEYWREYPIIRGHEPSGVVEEIGECVGSVKVGDRVSVYHCPACGYCETCLRGDFFKCTTIGPGYRLASQKVHGGDADFVLVPENQCMPLPDELDFEDRAIIACAGGTAYSALKKAKVSYRERVAVFGAGPVGLCAVMLAKAMGGLVFVVEPVEERRSLAKKLGADEAIDPTTQNAVESITERTQGGATVGIETSGSAEARADIVEAIKPDNGRIVYVGIGSQDTVLCPEPRRLGGRWITGSQIFKSYEYFELVGLLLDQNLHLSRMVTHRFSIEQAQEAFEVFETRETGKIIFTWN